MGSISLQIPQAGQPNSTEDPKIASDLSLIQSTINGGLDATNLAAAAAQSAGLNQSGQTVKGAVSIATSQSVTSTTYTTLPTPDQVSGLVVPTNGLVLVWYQAMWQESVAGAARAAIFIGPNQVQVQGYDGSTPGPHVQAAATLSSGTVNTNYPLVSFAAGLGSGQSSVAYGADVTTGQIIGFDTNSGAAGLNQQIGATTCGAGTAAGGPCAIGKLPAGTYTVSVRFLSSSGSVTVANRSLNVQVLSFA